MKFNITMTLLHYRDIVPRFTTALVVLLAVLPCSFGQNSTCLSDDGIQDIRLVDGTYGDFMGRVEIKYNGIWGTICDDFWSSNDVDVVCRMMGFRGSVCAVSRARFGAGPISSPIWLDNVFCDGEEDCLGDCTFIGLGDHVFCSHSEDAGVICLTDDLAITPPTDLTLVNSTTNAITLQFNAIRPSAQVPTRATALRYRLSYSETGEESATTTRNLYFFPSTSQRNELQYTRVLTNLRRDTEYSVQVAVDYRYTAICFSYITGSLSDKLIVRTNATSRPTNIPIRLVTPPGRPTFMGRIEVLYNGTWGTVCDDFFGTSDANLFCRGLGFEQNVCTPFSSISGPGTGPIWLDNLNCPSTAEILEDCFHLGWGVHNCRHRDDVEVICHPGESYLGTVSKPAITDIHATSAVVSWERDTFPNDENTYFYQVLYRPVGGLSSFSKTVSGLSNEATLTGLIVGETYIVTVRLQVRFSLCSYNIVSGKVSDAVNFTATYAPPEGPPTNFHVVVLNSTAVEVQWGAPLVPLQNGDIFGYIVFVMLSNGTIEEHDFPTDSTVFDVAVIINDLQPSTTYSFSVLAYNPGGRGPRILYLTANTFPIGASPLIIRFGINGDRLDRAVRSTFQRNLLIHCGTAQRGVEIDWFSPSGNKVGITDRNLRVGHYNNGTTVLQIASSRRLNPCDGGVYTCVANDTASGSVESKKFTLIIGSFPDRPIRPFPIMMKSNSIQIGWEPLLCTGSHVLIEYNIQYYEVVSFNQILQSVRHINISERNYTIKNLHPSTSYNFQIQVVTSDFRTSPFSLTRTVTTLPPAPSPPRDISVRIVSDSVIEVSWRPPATPNGVIIMYTVYVLPLSSRGGQTTRRKRQRVQSPDTTIMRFSGSELSGNVTVPSTDFTYNVQVTASVQAGSEVNEGIASTITTIFVPELEIPVPQNVRQVASTNSSITLRWDLPPLPFIPVEEFNVNYSSSIRWRTPMGRNIQFLESGMASISSLVTEVLISPLTPGTTYNFKIFAISEGEIGQEALATGSTLGNATDQGRVAFLQLRFGPVDKCSSFQTGNTRGRLNMVERAIIQEVNKLCLAPCGLTLRNLQNGMFSCGNGLVEQVIYRGRILGNDNNTAEDLVSLIQSWIDSDLATINAGFFRFRVDSTCLSALDSLDSPDCATDEPPPSLLLSSPSSTSSFMPTRSISLMPSSSQTLSLSHLLTQSPSLSPVPAVSVSNSGTSTGEAVIIVIGSLIILILVGVVILLSVLLFRKHKSSGKRFEGAVRYKNERAQKEVNEPFADVMEPFEFNSEHELEKSPIT